jgi:SAM-dependent methyltransferase
MAELPLPPVELALRVGVPDKSDALASYERLGRDSRRLVLDLLPDDWSFEGKRVLDFGSGAGKVLRHFAAEAAVAELHGCDIDGPSIEWLQSELCPPFHAFRNEEAPPLPVPDARYDLVLALSVFTHLTDLWSDWLLELHRVLRPDGLLIATFLGKAAYEAFTGKRYRERRIGHEGPEPAPGLGCWWPNRVPLRALAAGALGEGLRLRRAAPRHSAGRAWGGASSS